MRRNIRDDVLSIDESYGLNINQEVQEVSNLAKKMTHFDYKSRKKADYDSHRQYIEQRSPLSRRKSIRRKTLSLPQQIDIAYRAIVEYEKQALDKIRGPDQSVLHFFKSFDFYNISCM